MKLSRLIPFSLVFDRLVECQEKTNAGHLKKCSSSEIVNWKNAMKEWKHTRNGNFTLFKIFCCNFQNGFYNFTYGHKKAEFMT